MVPRARVNIDYHIIFNSNYYGVAIRQGLDDEDVIDDVTISTVPVVIGTGRRLFGGRSAQW